MQQKHDISSTIPACGVALSLASFGAACKAESPATQPERVDQKQVAAVQAKEPLGHTFFQFTDIDFRKIMNVPIYSPSITDSVVSATPATKIEAAVKSGLSSTTSHSSDQSEPGGGLVLAAVAPLFGAGKGSERKQKGFFGRLFSGGGDPDPEKTEKKTDSYGPSTSTSTAPEEKEKSTWRQTLTKAWKLWERPTELLPSPWNTVVKWGVPAIAITCGMVWFQTVMQVGLVGAQLFGGMIKPLAGAAGFLVPMVAADPIMKGIEKLFHLEPITGLKRQAILKPIQAGLLTGAAIWVHALDLAPITYAAWSAAAVATGWLATKIFKHVKASTWTAVAAAVALPWTHLATQRTFDVTVLNAGPDPEVGAWNVTTDLSIMNHWKSVAFFGKQGPPSGKPGMVFLNRDVPLYLPPHREANQFNGHFSSLTGQKVRITTIGVWAKMFSPKLQPTIVKYKVLEPETNSIASKLPVEQK